MTPGVRTAITDRVNAGSYVYGAVNSTFANALAQLGFRLSRKWSLALGADQTFWGVNTAQGTRFLLTLAVNDTFDSAHPRKHSELFETENDEEFQRLRGFDVDTQPEEMNFKEDPIKPKKPIKP
jgi:hypothetical protein